MSVVVIARFTVPDVNQAREAIAAHGALLDEITEEAKGMGALHHRFLAGDGEILVLDEWGEASQFESFFQGNAKVGQVTAAAGVTGPPEVSVFASMEAAGTF